MLMRKNLFLLTVCLLFLHGCGGQKLPEGMPKLTPVNLIVMQDGTPLDGAVVSLIPTDNSRWNAGGVTDRLLRVEAGDVSLPAPVKSI